MLGGLTFSVTLSCTLAGEAAGRSDPAFPLGSSLRFPEPVLPGLLESAARCQAWGPMHF